MHTVPIPDIRIVIMIDHTSTYFLEGAKSCRRLPELILLRGHLLLEGGALLLCDARCNNTIHETHSGSSPAGQWQCCRLTHVANIAQQQIRQTLFESTKQVPFRKKRTAVFLPQKKQENMCWHVSHHFVSHVFTQHQGDAKISGSSETSTQHHRTLPHSSFSDCLFRYSTATAVLP